MDRIFIPLYRFLKRNRALMYVLLIASSLVFIYFGTKVTFVEDITKLLPQEGPASKSSLVFDDLKVKDMIILQVTAEGKKGAELAQLSDSFVEQLLKADSTRCAQAREDGSSWKAKFGSASDTTLYISNILSGINIEKDGGEDDGDYIESNLEGFIRFRFPNSDKLLSTVNVDKLLASAKDNVDTELNIDSLKSYLPVFISESQLEQFDSLLTPEALDSTMKNTYDYLESNYGDNIDLIQADPAGLMAALIPSGGTELMGGVRLVDGHLMSADSTVALSFIAPAFNSVASDKCAALVNMIEEESLKFEQNNPGADVLFHGIPVNGAYNSRQIKKDVVLTLGISLLIICVIFGFIFRNKSTLPLLLAPIAWGAMFALSCVYWIQGSISLLAMGIGAVILGVALSYCLHIITHYKYVSKPEKVLKDQSTPVILGAVTTVGAFIALLFTNSSLLKDFGIFATLAITGTVFFSLVFTPQFLKPEKNKVARKIFRALDKINEYPFDKLVVFRWLLVIACGICIWASSKVGFDSDLRNIGYHDKEVIRSREVYSEKFNNGNLSLYFATFADTKDQALEYTAKLTHALDSLKQEGKVCSYMDISRIFIPEKEQLSRIDNWNAYWSAERIDGVAAALDSAAKNNLGDYYYQGMFDPFIETVSNRDHKTVSLYESELIPKDVISNFIDSASCKSLVMTSAVMPHDCIGDVSQVLNDIPEVVVVDPNFYTSELVKIVNEDFDKVLGISSIFVFIILILSFKSLVLALIAFIPMSVSWYVVQGVMGLMGQDFNMINIVIATFIFGVGVDYSIFVMKGLIAKVKREDKSLLLQHKTAIFLSAFMLILVLGSLLFATHPAIYSIGLTTLIGMSATVLLTYTIQPALFRFMTRFKFFQRIIK